MGSNQYLIVKKLGDIISVVRRGLDHHFSILTTDLEAIDGPYICGSEFSLADVRLGDNSFPNEVINKLIVFKNVSKLSSVVKK